MGMSAKHVPSTQKGRAAGINRGLEGVTTRFVMITDDDCLVDKDWIKNMGQQLRGNPEAIVTGRVEAAGEGDVLIVVNSEKAAIYRRPRLKFDAMSGGNMGTSMGVVRRVGLFDEDFCLRTAEDCEWSYRALRRGIPIIYSPKVSVKHCSWRDKEERVIQYRTYAQSHGGFYGKYIRKGDLFIVLRAIVHHLRALRRWLRGIITQDKELALCGRAYFTGMLPGIIAGIRGGGSS
jgi:GT2 family glycosyltransferase